MDSKNLTLFNRIKDSDIYFSFIKSPTAIVSTIILIIIFFCSFFVEIVTHYNPFDPSSLSLMDAFTPPSWTEHVLAKFIFQTFFDLFYCIFDTIFIRPKRFLSFIKFSFKHNFFNFT